jgi:hypothetical protein
LKYFNQLIIYEMVEMNSTKTIQFEAEAAAAGSASMSISMRVGSTM